MNITESLEFTTWTADEIREAIQPAQIKKVKAICRLLSFAINLLYIITFFSIGIYLKKHGIISDSTVLQNLIALVLFTALFIPIYFITKYATVVIASKLRITPRRLARLILENWKCSITEIAVIVGVQAGI